MNPCEIRKVDLTTSFNKCYNTIYWGDFLDIKTSFYGRKNDILRKMFSMFMF